MQEIEGHTVSYAEESFSPIHIGNYTVYGKALLDSYKIEIQLNDAVYIVYEDTRRKAIIKAIKLLKDKVIL